MLESAIAHPTKQSSPASKIPSPRALTIIAIGMDPRAPMQTLVINFLSPLIPTRNVEISSRLALQTMSRKAVQKVESIVMIRNTNFSVSSIKPKIKNAFGETPNVIH